MSILTKIALTISAISAGFILLLGGVVLVTEVQSMAADHGWFLTTSFFLAGASFIYLAMFADVHDQ